jgi:type II secretory pathway predicted ATPase ExeA
VLTGDSGVGKTFALRALRERLPNGRFHLHYIPNASLNLRDFYRQLSSVLGLEARATAAALFRQVSAQLETLATAQRIHPVLLLDEAHLLPLRVLENLHILLNFKWDSAALLSIVLIGLPELRERLRRNVLSSLATRLPVRAELAPLPRACVAAYLNHRMTRAGCAQQVFGEEAALLIAEATGRIPAKINTLAEHCLELAGEGRSQIVDGPMVQEARKRCAEAIQ